MKRKLSLTFAAVMTLSVVLSGCQKNNTPSAQQPATPAEQTDSGDGRAMEGNLYLTGLPIVQEQEEFSILVDDSGLAEDKLMYPILEEQTNVKVNLMLFPYDAAVEKKNLLLNSGDYPDVIGGWLLADKDIMQLGTEEHIAIPLEGLIEKYSPQMTEILNKTGVHGTMTLPDGHIYTIPYVIGEPLVTFSPFINQEWLDQLGLPMPTTTQEFKDTLIAFRDNIADINGQKIIPFSGDPNSLNIGTLAGWFGVNAAGGSGANLGYFAMIDGKVQSAVIQDGYKEFIKYFADLYKENLIDPELFTQDNAQWKSKGKAGFYGVGFAYGSGDFYETDPVTNRTPYEPLPVLKSDYTDNPVYRRNGYGVTTFRTQVIVTDAAKNPATIIRWFDNVFELENSVQIQAGLLGVKIEKVEEGVYREIDTVNMPEDERKRNEWANMFTQSLPKYIPEGFEVLPPAGQEKKYDENKAVDALYGPYLDEAVPKAWVAADDAARSSIIVTDINEYVKKKQAEWISGQSDVEAEWDTFKAELEKLGVSELTEIKQRAIDNMQ